MRHISRISETYNDLNLPGHIYLLKHMLVCSPLYNVQESEGLVGLNPLVLPPVLTDEVEGEAGSV